jgi:hypothetical protein
VSEVLSRCIVDLSPSELEKIQRSASAEANADAVHELQHRFGALLDDAKSTRGTGGQLLVAFAVELAVAQLRVYQTLHFREIVAGLLGASSADVCEEALVALARQLIEERRE